MKKITVLLITAMLLSLSLAACDAMRPAATPAPAAEQPAPAPLSNAEIVAEGRLVPNDSVSLSFVANGQVVEILAKEGDQVEAGQVIARLGNREPLEAAIAAAQAGLLADQQAYDSLFDNLEQMQNAALQKLNAARQAVKDAEGRVKNISGTASQADIEIARSQVLFAKNALDDAEKEFKRFASLPEDNLARARYRVILNEKQKAYDAAVRKYNSLIGTTNDFDRVQVQTDLEIAQKTLELAQKDYDQLQAGPDADQVAATQARINSAKAQLASTQAALNNLELHTPIAGKIVSMNLKVGEQVAAGGPVAEVADLSKWFFETDNLTEIDVVSVQVGQVVKIVADALPEVTLAGEVVSIKDFYEEKRGETTYTVKGLVKDPDPRLRWGMTVVVTFQSDEP